MEQQGLGEMNDKGGGRFADFCANAKMYASVAHGRQRTDAFRVRIRVRQWCFLSPFMILLTIDWIMMASKAQRRSGIQRTLWKQLDDLDFADDLSLLTHN